MPGVGEKLREHRVKRGLTIQEVEEQTKIRGFYIEAIENEDYKILPGKVYIIGFLKNYCKVLRISPTEIIDEFNSSWPDRDNVKDYVNGVNERKKKAPKEGFNYNKLLRFSIIVVAVAILLTVNHFWDRTMPNLLSPDPYTIGQNGSYEDANGNYAVEQPRYSGVNLEIIPARANCWLEVTIGNEVVFSGMLSLGQESLAFQSESEIHVRFGSAGAVDVVLNGELLEPIGNVGEVVERAFSLELEG